MSLIVAKFGGTSVADVPRIEAAADKIAAEVARGHQVAVVVSAMAGVTNQLVAYCHDISNDPDPQELDAVTASGEQVTSGLMALALQKRGIQSRSWQGWQAGIRSTDAHAKARVMQIDTAQLHRDMQAGVVPVVAGFQGVSGTGRITTLGRGGSDTSALALAGALQADRCDIYTDVDGIYTTDPRIVPKARKIGKISYEEMLEMASLGAKVLHHRSVEIAMKMNVPLQVLSSFEPPVGSDLPGTYVTSEGRNMLEEPIISAVAYSKNDAQISVLHVPDEIGAMAAMFDALGAADINVDMIVQNTARDGQAQNITFTAPKGDLPRALDAIKGLPYAGVIDVRHAADVAKVSIIGVGMISHSGVAAKMFRTLADKKVPIHTVSTSEIKISVLIPLEFMELAVRSLHTAFGLDAAEAAA